MEVRNGELLYHSLLNTEKCLYNYVELNINTLTGPIIPKPFADLSLNENGQVKTRHYYG